MQTADLLCVIYVTGIRNNELREKLLEISRPNIEKFDRVVDSFDQAKKQLEEMRTTATSAATQQTRGRQQQRNSRPNNSRRPETRDKGKTGKLLCYRCGKKDHLIADCPRPAHHSCGNCGKQGHIPPACRQAAANNASSKQEADLVEQLASMTVNNPLETQQGNAQTVHSLYSTAADQPTPTMFL